MSTGKDDRANSVDSNEEAQYQSPHLDLHSLKKSAIFLFYRSKRLNVIDLGAVQNIVT